VPTRETLMAELASLPSKRAALGDDAHREGLRETERLLCEKLRASGYEPVLWPFTFGARDGGPTPPVKWNNIIAEIPGARKPDEVVVIGAHFDAVENCPGADDNGTGVAALITIARAMRQETPDRTVRFVFFNCEEVGLVGSKAYAGAARRAQYEGSKRVVAMLSLEMLGYYCHTPGCQVSPIPPMPGLFEAPTVGDFLGVGTTKSHAWLARLLEREMTAASPGLKVLAPDFIPDLPITPRDLLRSDHAPFLAIGVPAAIIADTANFRNPHYHKATDTIETIDAQRFFEATRGLLAATRALARSGTGPISDPNKPRS
jgi:Zn-dependent M28 family amino/carboxypeptidase